MIFVFFLKFSAVFGVWGLSRGCARNCSKFLCAAVIVIKRTCSKFGGALEIARNSLLLMRSALAERLPGNNFQRFGKFLSQKEIFSVSGKFAAKKRA